MLLLMRDGIEVRGGLRYLAGSVAVSIFAELVLEGYLLYVILDRGHICLKATMNVINSIF